MMEPNKIQLKTKNRLNYILKIRIDTFLDYISQIESKYESDLVKINNRVKDLATAKVPDDFLVDEYAALEEMQQIFRYSAIVALYSILEHSMNFFCVHATSKKSIWKNIKNAILYLFKKPMNSLGIHLSIFSYSRNQYGKGIIKAASYLENVCALEFPRSQHEWQELNKLHYIRNCIVHADGYMEITNSPEKIQNIIIHTKELSFKDERRLQVNKEYLEISAKNVKDFLGLLYEKYYNSEQH